MKKIIVILLIVFIQNNVLSQNYDKVIKSGIAYQIEKIINFIDDSPTIKQNYNDDVIYVRIAVMEKMPAMVDISIENQFYKSDIYNQWCIEINDKKILVLDDYADIFFNDGIDKEKYLCKEENYPKGEKEMVQSAFSFHHSYDSTFSYDYLYLVNVASFDDILFLEKYFLDLR